jgi:hypothetical protein
MQVEDEGRARGGDQGGNVENCNDDPVATRDEGPIGAQDTDDNA